MRIDCFIMNPPYSNGPVNITDKINEKIKNTKPNYIIAIHPMYRTTKYKTAEFVENPFTEYNPKNNNLWIFDLLGDKNEYFSDNKNFPYWETCSKSNKILYARWNYNYELIELENYSFAFRRGFVKDNIPMDFVEWLQTNEYAQWCRKTFFQCSPKTNVITRLWEIYNENR